MTKLDEFQIVLSELKRSMSKDKNSIFCGLNDTPGVYLVSMVANGEWMNITKVGFTKDLLTRLMTIGASIPTEVRLITFEICESGTIGRRLEKNIMDFFKEKRIKGEWFTVDPSSALRALSDLAGYRAIAA